jgi:hypothetical protein
MKKTPLRLRVRSEVIRTLTDRDLTTAVGGANPNPDLTKVAGGCASGAAAESTP